MSYLIGAASVTNYADVIPLPEGTQTGDLIIVALIGGLFGPAAANVPDDRMELIDNAGMDGRPTWVGYGTVGEDLDPVAVELRGGIGAIGQFASGLLLTYRGMEADPTRVVHAPVDEESGTGEGIVPALPGQGTGAFGVLLTSSGFGGAYSSIDWARTGLFVDQAGAGSYAVVSVAWAANTEVPEFPQPQTDPTNSWRVVVFGYNDITLTVVRQWPRDDGRGLSGATRIHPVPRGPGLRVHGGIP